MQVRAFERYISLIIEYSFSYFATIMYVVGTFFFLGGGGGGVLTRTSKDTNCNL